MQAGELIVQALCFHQFDQYRQKSCSYNPESLLDPFAATSLQFQSIKQLRDVEHNMEGNAVSSLQRSDTSTIPQVRLLRFPSFLCNARTDARSSG